MDKPARKQPDCQAQNTATQLFTYTGAGREARKRVRKVPEVTVPGRGNAFPRPLHVTNSEYDRRPAGSAVWFSKSKLCRMVPWLARACARVFSAALDQLSAQGGAPGRRTGCRAQRTLASRACYYHWITAQLLLRSAIPSRPSALFSVQFCAKSDRARLGKRYSPRSRVANSECDRILVESAADYSLVNHPAERRPRAREACWFRQDGETWSCPHTASWPRRWG